MTEDEKLLESVSFDQMVACINRELEFRRRQYPNFVKSKKITQELADRQMLHLRAVHRALVKMKRQQEAQEKAA